MKKRFYVGVIVLAVLLLALGGLIVRSTAAVVRSRAGFRPGGSRVDIRYAEDSS
jgi:hypothetical protein